MSGQDEYLAYILEVVPEFYPHAKWLIIPPTREEVIDQFPDAEGCTLLRESDTLIHRWSRYSHYLVMRLTGNSHRFSEMVCMQQAARGMTDDIFFSGFGMLGDQFRNEKETNERVAAARSYGVNVTSGMVYMPNLARFRNDPEAWISRSDGRHRIQQILEKRGVSDECGNIKGEVRQRDPDEVHAESVPLADDIIESSIRQRVAENPDLAKLSRTELRDQVIEKHGMSPPLSD